jgi:hypothetical protein
MFLNILPRRPEDEPGLQAFLIPFHSQFTNMDHSQGRREGTQNEVCCERKFFYLLMMSLVSWKERKHSINMNQ